MEWHRRRKGSCDNLKIIPEPKEVVQLLLLNQASPYLVPCLHCWGFSVSWGAGCGHRRQLQLQRVMVTAVERLYAICRAAPKYSRI